VKVSRDRLIGWLCVLRMQFNAEQCIRMPRGVQAQLIEEGWLEVDTEEDWEGHRASQITQKGVDVSDMHGADWGIAVLLEAE